MLEQWTPPSNVHYSGPPSASVGTTLLIVGGAVLLLGAAMLVAERRSPAKAGTESDATADAVADAPPEAETGAESQSESQSGQSSQHPGTVLIGLGIALAGIGGILLAIRLSAIQDQDNGLHAAAQQVIDQAVSAAQECTTAPPSPLTETLGASPAVTLSVPLCWTNPRQEALSSPGSQVIVNGGGVYTAVPVVSFDTTGEVLVTNSESKQTACAVVPDSAGGTGSVTLGPCPGPN